VVFANTAAVEQPLERRLDAARFAYDVGGVDTNISQALQVARTVAHRSRADSGSRIVLISDGLATQGDFRIEAAHAAAEGIAIDVSPPPADDSSLSPVVTGVHITPVAKIMEPVRLSADLRGAPRATVDVELVSESGRQLRRAQFSERGTVSVAFEVTHQTAGAYTYRVIARDPATDIGAASEAGGVVVVTGKPRVLYVGESSDLVTGALGSGFDVSRLEAANLGRLPTNASAYDAVILDDISPETFDDATLGAALVRYVEQQAGGLLVLGSPRSLQAGLPSEHGMRHLLPVDLRPRRGERAPAAALLVVFDRSGSMADHVGGVPKIEFARQAVARALESVTGSDLVGVIAFNDTPADVIPVSPAHGVTDVSARLRDIVPGGPTAITPALERAAARLRSLPSETRKHVLLLSDGRTSSADATRAQALVRNAGFELTAVALGGDTDQGLLSSLAEATGGRAYFPEDIRELPSVLAREASRVAGGGIVAESFVPQTTPHPILSGLTLQPLPRLGGYVATSLKSGAVAPVRSHLYDPILGLWNVGLGRAGVYTADLHASWSRALVTSPQYPQLLRQTIRWLSRRTVDSNLYAHVSQASDGRLRIDIDATDGGDAPRADLNVRAVISSPAGNQLQVPIPESEPGRYQTFVPANAPGAYLMTISADDRAGTFSATTLRGVYVSAEREYQRADVDRAALEALAKDTGGRVLAPGQSAFDAARPRRYRDMQGAFVLAALFLFMGERLAPGVVRTVRGWRHRDTFVEDAA
jgi:Ca-activated chloride channel family protein